ncbi:UNVERIFIED_CONTAM: Retrovirus-related Pol polyprotein from transposon RE1 [Sesamum calycinum]|uniref:Retrovirus-related Pol polyprotein from transposon RE1 n=1 Tax=Sesamum calycinum TaxID=2727403 RepID=A0AAW2NX33_9LAMI
MWLYRLNGLITEETMVLNGSQNLNRGGFRGKITTDKRSQVCGNCGRTGHTKDTCFKLHGVPDWYRELKDQKRREGGLARGFNVISGEGGTSTDGSNNIGEAMKQMTELIKLMKENIPPQDPCKLTLLMEMILQDLQTKEILAVVLKIALGFGIKGLATLHFMNSFINAHVLTHLNRMVLLRGNISTYLTLLGPFSIRLHFLVSFGVDVIHEPRTFAEANKHPQWRAAMDKELEALENNSTWDLTTLPAGKRAIGSRWVYKVKLHQDGSIERYKARLVAKGYTQVEGVDFFDSFSPVAKTVTVRLFIAIASAYRWPLLQLDVNNAFLHGHLDEEVYMVPPEGYDKAHGGLVCRLKRSLYGLKQASRQWNIELTSKLESYGFTQSPHDHCLFTLRKDSLFLALIVYVDDVLLTGNSLDDLNAVKSYLDDLFTIKDLGNAKYFLGLELAFCSRHLSLLPLNVTEDWLVDFYIWVSHALTFLLPFNSSVNSFNILANHTGMPLSLGSTRIGLLALILGALFLATAFSWVILLFPGKPRSKPPSLAPLPRQNTEAWVLLCELLWVSYILGEFGIPLVTPIPFHCDNKAAIHITENPVFHERTKHLDIDCHLVRDQFKHGFILPTHFQSTSGC